MNDAREPEDDAVSGPEEPESAAAPNGPAQDTAPSRSTATPAPASPQPGGEAQRPELVRDNERGLVTGVCAGLGSYTGIDPIVWRVAFAITGLAGFTGVLLYVGAWMSMRDADRGPAMFEQLLNRRIDDRAVPALLGLGVALATALSLIGGVSWGTLMLATPLILGVLVSHNRGVDLRRAYRDLPGLLKSGEPPPTTPEPEPKPAYYNPAQPWAQAPSGPVDLAVVADRGREYGNGAADGGSRDGVGEPGADRDDGDGNDADGDGGAGGEGVGGEGVGGRSRENRDDDSARHSRASMPFLGHARQRERAHAARERAKETRERHRRRRRDRRARRGTRLLNIVGWLVIAAAAITLGATGTPFAEALFGPQTGPTFLGSVVVVIGLALVAGAWVGDPRGLITAGALVALLLVASVTVDLSSMRFGSMQWSPATAAAAGRPYELTAGDARLDLTRLPLDPGQRVRVDAGVRFGQIAVVVPESARVVVRGRAAFGEIRIGETVRWGTGLDMRRTLEPVEPAEAREVPGRGADLGPGGEQQAAASAEPPTLVVDLISDIGDLEVRRAAS